MSETLDDKYRHLSELIAGYGSALVAFSGGADSALVLKVAVDLLGDDVLAVTAVSPTYPEQELEEAMRLAKEIGARLVTVETQQMELARFVANDGRRCYFCKSELYGLLKEMAVRLSIANVLDGTNLDDLSDYRPGLQASEELKVRSPLTEAGFTKADIRELSRRLGLPTWDKPAMACLSSRFPHGTEITVEKLSQVERAEELLRSLGFRQLRVRYHNEVARIEIDEWEMEKLLDPEVRRKVVEGLEGLGFQFVALDLKGYRQGSLNPAPGR